MDSCQDLCPVYDIEEETFKLISCDEEGSVICRYKSGTDWPQTFFLQLALESPVCRWRCLLRQSHCDDRGQFVVPWVRRLQRSHQRRLWAAWSSTERRIYGDVLARAVKGEESEVALGSGVQEGVLSGCVEECQKQGRKEYVSVLNSKILNNGGTNNFG